MTHPKMTAKEDALALLFQNWSTPIQTEMVAIENACGRILAENQYSEITFPVCRASDADGVAVVGSRFENTMPDTQSWKIGTDYVRADTGDDFPDTFDTVIPIERVLFDELGRISFSADTTVRPGQCVSQRGSYLSEGVLLMRANQPIRPMDIGAFIMGGKKQVPVYKLPRVAFIPTGSELIPAGTVPQRGENIDSNSLMIKAMLTEMGADTILFPIVKDKLSDLEQTLDQALAQADIILINGGSSKGSEDYNVELMRKRGKVLVHRVSFGPGMPICIALVNDKPVIIIPGPPIGAINCMDWCVRPILSRFCHVPEKPAQRITGVLTAEIHCPPHMEFRIMLNVRRSPEDGFKITPVNYQTATIPDLLSANAWFVSKIGESYFPADTVIEAELLRGEEFLN